MLPKRQFGSSYKLQGRTTTVPASARYSSAIVEPPARKTPMRGQGHPVGKLEAPGAGTGKTTMITKRAKPVSWRDKMMTGARLKSGWILKWSLVSGIVIGTIFLAWDTYQVNLELKRRIDTLSSVTSNSSTSAEQRQQAEGTDETIPTAEALSKYTVSPNMPRTISIQKIGVKARVFQMDTNIDGSMQAPIGIYDAGWYTGSARPGISGAAVMDAHSSGPTRQGLFGRLDQLTTGDVVEIELGDAKKISYRVMHKESVAKESVDMKKLLSVYGKASEGLNLITCTGTWMKREQTYSNRTIIYTERAL